MITDKSTQARPGMKILLQQTQNFESKHWGILNDYKFEWWSCPPNGQFCAASWNGRATWWYYSPSWAFRSVSLPLILLHAITFAACTVTHYHAPSPTFNLFTLLIVSKAARQGGLVGTLRTWLTQVSRDVIIVGWVGNRSRVVLEVLHTSIWNVNSRVLLQLFL